MAVGTGLQVMAAMMNADVEAACKAQRQARSGPDGGAPRRRGRLGHPRWAPGARAAAADARHRRDGGAAGGFV
jgi:hypothetical protein